MAQAVRTAPAAEPASPRAGGEVHLPYMPALDGLRGLAVAGAALHAGHLVGGYVGVDLFFVLSGFLITSPPVTEGRTAGGIDLVRFWARRARRLLPALAGVMVAVVAYAWLLAEPVELARIRAGGLATLAYVANWRAVVAEQDYFDLFVSPSPLQLRPDPPIAVFNAAPPGCTFPGGATRSRSSDGTVHADPRLDCQERWERDLAAFDPHRRRPRSWRPRRR